MTALPEPATVTPDVARQLLREIRRHRRPQLLDELKRLYRGGGDAVMSRAEILSGEIRLQTLDRYLMRLLPIAAGGNRSLGWESFRPLIRAVTHEGRSRVDAEVDLAFSPENHECVHGPLTLVPVTRLAGRLLAPGERVSDVERVTWAAPLRQQVRLSMWDATNCTTKDGDGAVSGVLRTSFGRTLQFAGVPLEGRPLVAQRDYNLLSQALVAGTRLAFGPDGSELTLELSDSGLAACRRAVRRRPGLCAALVLDLVPIAILNWKRGRPMMCCGYRDVPLPAPPAAAFMTGARLELRYREDLSHASARSGLWIGHYEFRYLPRQSAWSTMVMAEADDIGLLLRTVHS